MNGLRQDKMVAVPFDTCNQVNGGPTKFDSFLRSTAPRIYTVETVMISKVVEGQTQALEKRPLQRHVFHLVLRGRLHFFCFSALCQKVICCTAL